jgi:hypothetical protein
MLPSEADRDDEKHGEQTGADELAGGVAHHNVRESNPEDDQKEKGVFDRGDGEDRAQESGSFVVPGVIPVPR